MSYPRLPGFKSFFDLPSLSDILLLILPYIAPKVWARRQMIASFAKRRIDTIIISTIFAGMAALVREPITSTVGIIGGPSIYGGTSTAITSRLTFVYDLTPLFVFLVIASACIIITAVVAEYRRMQQERASLQAK